MKYRIVYRKSIADGVDDNELRGEGKNDSLKFLDDCTIFRWAAAFLEATYDDKVWEFIGPVTHNLRNDRVTLMTEHTFMVFDKHVLKELLMKGEQWHIIQEETLQTVNIEW